MIEIELQNSQKEIEIDLSAYQQVAERVIKETGLGDQNYLIELLIVSDKKIQALNKNYLKKDAITDVLSFPQISIEKKLPQKCLGSIIIAPKYAKKTKQDLTDLFKHGLLHLLGYDHDTSGNEWIRIEQKINH